MKVRLTMAAVAASMALLTTGCSSAPVAAPTTNTVTATAITTATVSGPTSTVVSTVVSTVPLTVVSTVQETVAPPTPPTTAATATAAGGVKNLGQPFDFQLVKVTVLQTKIPITVGTRDPDPGNKYAGALVQTCVEKGPEQGSTLSWNPWQLEDADGGQYPSESSKGDDSPKPVYPFAGDTVFKNGECAKGWIVFQVPTTAKPVHVRYSIMDPDYGSLLGLWAIK